MIATRIGNRGTVSPATLLLVAGLLASACSNQSTTSTTERGAVTTGDAEPNSSGAAPTVLAELTTALAPLTLSPELIAQARQIMDDDPYIHPVIGDNYQVMRIDPYSASGSEPQGAAFAIEMSVAVTFPVGSPAWRDCGETGVCDDGRSPGPTTLDQPLGPFRQFFILVSVTEGRVHAILPIPDELDP